ncbi:DUF1289 domain-containing protein [Neisseria canis]|uniref:Predicted Fe-S protein n=1 Tax=Neisseria canis TaxID=493 RepID=A0A448D8W9_9NEIS|nr:DUF1289 domain-containing protein [Neisseria canis]OSI13224.1 hypothetical protein BWD07_01165 [Neisseria canis]VEF01884.1 Predicted Fe-S protein [Neisseria canis]
MNQPDFFEIPSPCIGVCRMNGKGYCKGCFRSREERLYWLHMTDEQKHQVMRLIAMRRKKVQHAAWEKMQPHEEAPEQEDLGF